jgi:hypothetical protein
LITVCLSCCICDFVLKCPYADKRQDSTLYPDLMFGFQQQYNPVRSICFHRALQGPIAFQAVMVISAAHLSVLRGFQAVNMDPGSIRQRAQALRLLNDALGNITERTCMDILFGILSLASAEVRYPTFFHCYVFFVVNFDPPVKPKISYHDYFASYFCLSLMFLIVKSFYFFGCTYPNVLGKSSYRFYRVRSRYHKFMSVKL